MKLRIILIAISLILSWQAAAEAMPLSGVTRTEHFVIRHDPDFIATADVIGQACESWLDEIGRRLDFRSPPGALIHVFLYRDQQEFSRGTGLDRPGQVLGRASTEGYIDLDASGIFASAEQIAGHEITHVVLFRLFGGRMDSLPLWVSEGTAKYLSSDWDIVDRTTLTNAAMRGQLLPLSSLVRSFPSGNGETLAYAESASAIKFFVESYGEHRLAKLLHATARTGSFEAAMREVTGQSTGQFERRWVRRIEGNYAVLRAIRFGSLIGALAMPVLAIAAYLGVRRLRRRAIEWYEQEEEVED